MSEQIRFSGLDEFRAKLMDISREYSDTAEKHLNAAGNKLKHKAKEETPINTRNPVSRKNRKKKAKHMRDAWKSEIVDKGDMNLEYWLRNTSPHFHLIEHGHIIKVHNKTVGFYQGKHFFEKTVKEFTASGEMQTELEKFMREVKKKMG